MHVMEPSAALAETLSFERDWALYLKSNTSGWEMKHMKHIFTVHTIADFWRMYNNIPLGVLGAYNLFMMQHDVLPLWELNGDLFRKGGGCWSVVIRSRGSWLSVMHELAMAIVGEVTFSERVLGVCFVPVSESHIICKIWCSQKRDEDGKHLSSVLCSFTASAARFKGFN